jgi:hypothetical protein
MSAAASGRRLNFRHAAERTRVLFLSVRQTPDLTASAQPGIAGEIPRQACKIACAGRAVATLLGSERVGTKLAMIIPALPDAVRVRRKISAISLSPALHRCRVGSDQKKIFKRKRHGFPTTRKGKP